MYLILGTKSFKIEKIYYFAQMCVIFSATGPNACNKIAGVVLSH